MDDIHASGCPLQWKKFHVLHENDLPMTPLNERKRFSERLRQALHDAHLPDSPTRLAKEFNIRSEGQTITVHTARKWLIGEAIPTQEKLRQVARWLGVTTGWLRFGDPAHAAPGDTQISGVPSFDSAAVRLIGELRSLDHQNRQIARGFIRMLLKINDQK